MKSCSYRIRLLSCQIQFGSKINARRKNSNKCLIGLSTKSQIFYICLDNFPKFWGLSIAHGQGYGSIESFKSIKIHCGLLQFTLFIGNAVDLYFYHVHSIHHINKNNWREWKKKNEERKNFVSIEHLCSRMFEFRHHEKSVCTILDMTGTAGCHIFALEHSYITEFAKIVFNG